jgi:hypothetical protein
MTVLNSRMEPQGRLAERVESGWVLDRTDLGPLSIGSFPREAGDDTPRFSVVMAARGDEVVIPHLATSGAQPRYATRHNQPTG